MDLPERLRPLAWMIGRWEGAGVVGYPTIESVNFGQEVECRHDGRNFLEWHSHTWLLDQETGEKLRPLSTELGFWRPGEDGRDVELLLAHPTGIIEIYYGKMEPAKAEQKAGESRLVTNLREWLVGLLGAAGDPEVLKLALEWVAKLKTDSVVRSPLAKEYNAGSRLYGLVESQLFWVMDMAAMGQELQSHVSAQLKRVG